VTPIKSRRAAGALAQVLEWPPPWVPHGEPEPLAETTREAVTQAEVTLRHFTDEGREMLARVLRQAIQRGRENGT
jgi:hypothetical protein